MKDRNKNTGKEDFLRYRQNSMTGKERNEFERKLQRDSFSEEADEGFAFLSSEEAEADIDLLNKKLSQRVKGNRRVTYYRIAASLAVLMVISSIYIIINRNKPEMKFSETSENSQPFEIIQTSPLMEPAAAEVKSYEKLAVREKKSKTSLESQPESEQPESISQTTEKAMVMADIKDIAPEAGKLSEEVYAANDEIAAAAPTLAKSMMRLADKNIEALDDSKFLEKHDSDQYAISEIVAAGYKGKASGLKKEVRYTRSSSPQPVNGKEAFDKYIEENIHHPDTLKQMQRVEVVVSFLVLNDGRLDSLKIIRSPGRQFSDEAKRLIIDGPSWKAAEENGIPVTKEVRVKIVFRQE